MGALRRLAREDLLEKVKVISSVSGGSLATALVFELNNYRWPTSSEFQKIVFPKARTLLTSVSLESALPVCWLDNAITRGLVGSWMLSQALYEAWGIRGSFSELAGDPVWFANATTYETGKSWRFTQEGMGDWSFGHYYYGRDIFSSSSKATYHMPICVGAAASASLPYLIGFLRLDLPEEPWFSVSPVTYLPTDPKSGKPVSGPRKSKARRVRLWDGGVYENLGLEAVYKPDRGIVYTASDRQVSDVEFLLVSDASAPLALDTDPALGPVNVKPPRFRGALRMPDIATDQTRALRSRMVMTAVKDGSLFAAYARLGLPTWKVKLYAEDDYPKRTIDYDTHGHLNDNEVAAAAGVGTRLFRLKTDVFDRLVLHGFESTDANLACHHPEAFKALGF